MAPKAVTSEKSEGADAGKQVAVRHQRNGRELAMGINHSAVHRNLRLGGAPMVAADAVEMASTAVENLVRKVVRTAVKAYTQRGTKTLLRRAVVSALEDENIHILVE